MLIRNLLLPFSILSAQTPSPEPDLVFAFDPRVPLVARLSDEILFALGLLPTYEKFLETSTPVPVRFEAVPGAEAVVTKRAPPGDAATWGFVKPSWLGFASGKGVLGRALAKLQRVRWQATTVGENEIVFEQTVETEDDRDARVVADALREFLAPFQAASNDAVSVRDALLRATVERSGLEVRLSLPLTETALTQLHHSDGSRRLLRLQFGALEREGSQNLDEVFQALDLEEGGVVADVGCGDGFFTVRLAEVVGESGRVYAVDVVPGVVSQLRARVAAAPYARVEVVLGAPDDPRLPDGALDAALIVNSYHEMPQHQAMLAHIRAALKPGGRLVLVEPVSEELRKAPREEQEKKHGIAPELVEEDLRRAGFEIVRRREAVTPREWLILAVKPLPSRKLASAWM